MYNLAQYKDLIGQIKNGGEGGVMRSLVGSDTYITAFDFVQFLGRRFVDKE